MCQSHHGTEVSHLYNTYVCQCSGTGGYHHARTDGLIDWWLSRLHAAVTGDVVLVFGFALYQISNGWGALSCETQTHHSWSVCYKNTFDILAFTLVFTWAAAEIYIYSMYVYYIHMSSSATWWQQSSGHYCVDNPLMNMVHIKRSYNSKYLKTIQIKSSPALRLQRGVCGSDRRQHVTGRHCHHCGYFRPMCQ